MHRTRWHPHPVPHHSRGSMHCGKLMNMKTVTLLFEWKCAAAVSSINGSKFQTTLQIIPWPWPWLWVTFTVTITTITITNHKCQFQSHCHSHILVLTLTHCGFGIGLQIQWMARCCPLSIDPNETLYSEFRSLESHDGLCCLKKWKSQSLCSWLQNNFTK